MHFADFYLVMQLFYLLLNDKHSLSTLKAFRDCLCLNKGSFTYYVISRWGEGVSKCLRLITGGGGGGLAVDYVIKILIFTLIPI